MCYTRTEHSLEGPKQKSYFLEWTCCNCDCGWSVKLHAACVNCGHWRCDNIDHSKNTASASLSNNARSRVEDTRFSATAGTPEDQPDRHAAFGGENPNNHSQHSTVMAVVLPNDDNGEHFIPASETHNTSFHASGTSKASGILHIANSASREAKPNDPNPFFYANIPGQDHDKAKNTAVESDHQDTSISEEVKVQMSQLQNDIEHTTPSTTAPNAAIQMVATETSVEPTRLSWREGMTPLGNYSTDSEIGISTESEYSFLTRENSDGSEIASPESNGDFENLFFVLRQSRSPATDRTDASSFDEIAGPSQVDLLEQPWFQDNVGRILHNFLQHWHGFRARARDESAGSLGGSSQHAPSPNQEQGSLGSDKRKQRADEKDEQKKEGAYASMQKRKKASETRRNLACPFCKKDLQEYQQCAKFGNTRIRDIKQHIRRNHENDVDEPTNEWLKLRCRSKSIEDQWYETFAILFPSHSPMPASPYNSFPFPEQPLQSSQISPNGRQIPETDDTFHEYITGAGAEVFHQAFIEDPVFSHLRESDIRTALGRVLPRLLETYWDHRMPQRRLMPTIHAIHRQTPEIDHRATLQAWNTHVSTVHNEETSHHIDCGDPATHGMTGHECSRDWAYQGLNQGFDNYLPIDDPLGMEQHNLQEQTEQVRQPGMHSSAITDEQPQTSDWGVGPSNVSLATNDLNWDDWLYVDYENSLEQGTNEMRSRGSDDSSTSGMRDDSAGLQVKEGDERMQ